MDSTLRRLAQGQAQRAQEDAEELRDLVVKSVRGELTAAEREEMVRRLRVKAKAGTLSKLEKRELIRAAVDRDTHDSFANLAERKKQEKLDAAARRPQAATEEERRADPVYDFIRESERGEHELSAE